jgi:uncharacterized membrane protein
MPYLFLAITLVGTIAGQLLLKKGLLSVGEFHANLGEVVPFFIRAFSNPYVLLAVFLVLVASLSWIIAVSKAELTHIYPLMGMTYVLVSLFSVAFFKENVTYTGWIGIALVSAGVVLVLRS